MKMVLLLELRTELYLLFFLYLWEDLEPHPNEHSEQLRGFYLDFTHQQKQGVNNNRPPK